MAKMDEVADDLKLSLEAKVYIGTAAEKEALNAANVPRLSIYEVTNDERTLVIEYWQSDGTRWTQL